MYNLETFIERYARGDFDTSDVKTAIDAGWYDWFCADKALLSKTKKLGEMVLQLVDSPKIDPKTNYVFFKNNSPLNGVLYDDFRICSMETGDVIYTVIPSCGHHPSKGTAQVWGSENDFKEPITIGSWNDVKRFFVVA